METSGFALVIGAGSGIGLESAFTFAEHGARGVAFADINLAAAQDASEKSKTLATSKEYQTLALAVDVVDRMSVRSMVAEVYSRFGRIDYAVNSAGVPRAKEYDVVDVDGDEFDRLHDINCKGILHCLQEEIAVMKTQEPSFTHGRSGRRSVGPGSIVNITSLSALIGSPKSATYTASKFAARGIIKCAALETRSSGLRINEICPGFTDTPLLQYALHRSEGLGAVIAKAMPLGRAAAVEEIASVVHFLASPASSFVTGQSWVVDSGVSMSVN